MHHSEDTAAIHSSHADYNISDNIDDKGGGTCGSAAEESLEDHQQIEYDCVICGQSSPSTLERPVGLVSLLQASSGNCPTFLH